LPSFDAPAGGITFAGITFAVDIPLF